MLARVVTVSRARVFSRTTGVRTMATLEYSNASHAWKTEDTAFPGIKVLRMDAPPVNAVSSSVKLHAVLRTCAFRISPFLKQLHKVGCGR